MSEPTSSAAIPGSGLRIAARGAAPGTPGRRPGHVPDQRAAAQPVDTGSHDPDRLVYATPAWVRPGPVGPVVPRQVGPRHDSTAMRPPVPEIVRPDGLLRQARWTSPRSGRAAVALLLLGSLAAAAATGSGVVDRQTTSGLALALACLLAATGLYAILVAVRPNAVELDEMWLTVRSQGRYDRFDLTHPFQKVEVSGAPGTSSWRLRLGCPDGRTVVVKGSMVDSRALDRVVTHAQRYADRDRLARSQRFHR